MELVKVQICGNIRKNCRSLLAGEVRDRIWQSVTQSNEQVRMGIWMHVVGQIYDQVGITDETS